MARLTTAARNRLPTSAFALPGRHYPIQDITHGRNALSRISEHGTPAQQATVRAAVHRKFPSIGGGLARHVTQMRARGAFRKAS